MSGEPEKIGDLILDSINKMGFAERIQRQSAVVRWSEIVGEKIAAETEALRVEGSTLVIKVYKAAWRQQLTFLKDELLARLEADLGKDHIADIRFV